MKNKWKIIAIVLNFGVGTCLFILYLINTGFFEVTRQDTVTVAVVDDNGNNENNGNAGNVNTENILPKADDYYENTNHEDNSWLIGSWGPITISGDPYNTSESTTIKIDIIDEHTLIETAYTKLTPEAIRTAKSKGVYTGDILEDRQTRHFTIDNQNNQIVFDGVYSAPWPFNKERQILDYGYGKGSEYYLKKKVSSSNDIESAPQNTSYTAITKAFFYNDPDENTVRGAYLVEGDRVTITKIQNGFGYTVFTNEKGQETKGWLKMDEFRVNNNYSNEITEKEVNTPTRTRIEKELSYSENIEKEKTQIYTQVDVMPSFPGGETALMKFLTDNLTYPINAADQGIQGRVILRFVVNSDGSISDVEVMRSIEKSCDNEAIRVIKLMPKWIPGKLGGVNVPVYYKLPIVYRLQND